MDYYGSKAKVYHGTAKMTKGGLTKKDIAENCKTSEVTVTNTYCQMIKFKKYLLPIEKK